MKQPSTMAVHFVFKHDVVAQGRRYICARVTVLQPAMPKTGLWGNTEVDVWVPWSAHATMEDLREGALSAARRKAAEFAKLPRSRIRVVSAGEE